MYTTTNNYCAPPPLPPTAHHHPQPLFQAQLQQQQPPQQPGAGGTCHGWLLCKLTLVAALLGILLLTYENCPMCVVGIAVFSFLTLSLPLMSVVFMLSMLILLYHAVTLDKASIRVELPLSNFIPTVDDLRQYIHFYPGAKPSSPVNIGERP